MEKNNVYSTAKIVNSSDTVQNYQLGTFIQNTSDTPVSQGQAVLNDREINGNSDPLLNEIRALSSQVSQMSQKIVNIENGGLTAKEIDAQVVQAIKDLKHYANFFEQATFQMESKLLKTSIAIAQKIIAIEIGENSSKIAKETISHLLDKIKNASKIQIHLNPKDYELLKNELNLENHIELVEDINVTAGGVVIASDLGNFDGNIEAKVNSMLESLDLVL
ncbi:FliH/SctL family protein [Halarcobacter anaerophilus]|jgi:flagellar assembly protein FliH|uniref:Flagellar assembly protein FliH n=1 Tax=Halarcobacter anaerophilus TaxID=877500 RepID=A0A4Q0Y3J8_9BACT|nr:FliH/SctL family protein [Halarcobacter anaerophilus]QDF29859.1 flagellar export apparatus, cytoplasmic ATPase complex, FliH component [Halarcobacter anaerophilus]RXJ62821.1 flagellar assembly protein FliH [Halarcobacter anaerophilus]